MKNFSTKTFLFVFLIFIFSKTQAQNFPYTLVTEMGSYSNLVDATELSSVGDNWDDPNYLDIPLGFNINIFDNFADKVILDDFFLGGLVSFNDLDDSESTPIIAVYFDDLMDVENADSLTQSTISYLTEGDVGSRIFKMEWNNCGFFDEIEYAGTSNNIINLQLWIYEGSENIEIRFGPSTLPNPGDIHLVGSPLIALIDEYIGVTDDLGTMWFPTGDPTAPTLDSITDASGIDYLVGFSSEPTTGMIYRFVNLETSTKTPFQDLKINVYPTLVTNEFFVEMDKNILDKKTQLIVTNNLGQQVFSKYITNTKERLDATDLPKGIYYVSILNEDGSGVQKIIKQ